MAIDFFSPEYQEMIRRSLAANPSAGLGYTGPGPIQGQAANDYYTNLAHGTAPYVQGSADLRAQGEVSSGNAAERIRQNLISFGIIPEGFQDKYGWVNPETRALAQKNTDAGLSTFARIQKAFADAQRKGKRALAARGMLHSGELGFQQKEQALLNRQQYADATGNLLNANRGIYDDYTNDFNARAAQWRDLENSAYGQVKDTPLPNAPSIADDLQAAWGGIAPTTAVVAPPPIQSATSFSPARPRTNPVEPWRAV